MTETITLFNDAGSLVSLLAGFVAIFLDIFMTYTYFTIIHSILIGGVTLTENVITWGK
ncbi:MAG: hypothetical protein ABI686_12295 [Acidobacteriota bacterium]